MQCLKHLFLANPGFSDNFHRRIVAPLWGWAVGWLVFDGLHPSLWYCAPLGLSGQSSCVRKGRSPAVFV